MKVALALLCDDRVHDAVARLAFDCHLQFGVALDARRIPPHISLKQPFEIGDSIEDLDAALSHLERFAAGMEPSEMRFEGCATWPGILHFPVVESDWLQAAHDRLNASLQWAPNSGRTDFDGSDYCFHLTVLSDQNAVAKVEQCLSLTQSLRIEPFTPQKGAVFVYHQSSPGSHWEYVHIKTVGLGTSAM